LTKHRHVPPAILIALLVLFSAPIAEAEEPDDAHHDDAAGHETGHHLRDFKNEVAVFLGITNEKGHDNVLTWGLDYKRRIAERWAVGGLFDYAGGELRNAIVAVSVSYWPGLGNLQLFAAPGIELHRGRDKGINDPGCGCGKSEEPGHGGADKDATYFLFRIGVAYDFHIGERFGIVPAINLDFVNNEEVWVYGLNFTYGF